MNRPLGCLTGGGLLAAGLTATLVLVFYLAQGGAMFSPGALNAQAGSEMLSQGVSAPVRSHADTGGRCAACHTAPWSSETVADRCQACHASVADELAAGRGLHAELRGPATQFDCRGCHPEHRGPAASLTDIRPEDFPHAATGYDLAGHRVQADGRPFACSDCHVETVSEFAVDTCGECHGQLDGAYMTAHLADFGPACLNCHDGVDRYGPARFDHNNLRFTLDGKHSALACRECHAGATTLAALQNPNLACVDCHRADDAHRGEFGLDCAACHNTTAWPDATFDHARTAFPLTGKHEGVDCEGCHRDGQFKGTSTRCESCHEDPAFHRGAFGVDCAACHTADGWQPATFDRRHTFPIDHGEGGPSSCRTCHPDNVDAYTCYGCHEHTPAQTMEEHAGEVSGDIADCVRCHPTGQEEEGEREGGED